MASLPTLPDKVYRVMREDTDGMPMCGDAGMRLGVRPPVAPGQKAHRADITPVNGMVKPETGGMSVAPDDFRNIDETLLPRSLGGQGNKPIYSIETRLLPATLKYRRVSAGHGFIEPATQMSLEKYQRELCATRHLWKKV